METEKFERMDGLIYEADKDRIMSATASIIRELKSEGFDSHEILEYIEELVIEGGNK